MSIELVETEDVHLDYSDVYTNKNSRISTTENVHKRPVSIQGTIIDIKAHRFHSNHILLSLTDQTTLFDLYTFMKVQCYKDAYHVRKPMLTIHQIPIDFIPPKPKNPLSCIVHQLAVINQQEDILVIPTDPKMTLKTFMETYPDFFAKSYGRYTIYILDEYAIQRHVHKKGVTSSFILDIENLVKKYLSCGPQR
jgi:hypothetical protein